MRGPPSELERCCVERSERSDFEEVRLSERCDELRFGTAGSEASAGGTLERRRVPLFGGDVTVRADFLDGALRTSGLDKDLVIRGSVDAPGCFAGEGLVAVAAGTVTEPVGAAGCVSSFTVLTGTGGG